MWSNDVTNPSGTAWIPNGIPTGVFVPNNQTPAQAPVQNTPAQAPVASASSAPASEGALDRFFKRLARSLAKVTGQPDPITGVSNTASQVFQKWQNIVGKVRGAANQVVEKATDVATSAVNTATNVATKVVDTTANVANKAVQKVQEVIPAPAATPTATPAPTVAPVADSTPVAPTTPTPPAA